MIAVPITTLPHFRGDLPTYETTGAAGLDLRAAIDAPRQLAPGGRDLIPTGLAAAVPLGFELQIRPRSGLALKHGLTCLNSPGTIDSDYRGEIQIILANLGQEAFTIEPQMRIAQAVLAAVAQLAWQPVDELPSSERGSGGFGSTGTH